MANLAPQRDGSQEQAPSLEPGTHTKSQGTFVDFFLKDGTTADSTPKLDGKVDFQGGILMIFCVFFGGNLK